jgi:hypothetical protein
LLALSVLTASVLTACSSGAAHGTGAGGSAVAAGGAGGASSVAGAPTAATGGASAPDSPGQSAASNTSKAAGSGGSGSVDACSLLTVAQASSLNDITYTSAKAQSPTNGYNICIYHNSGKHPDPVDIQDLTVTVLSIGDCWAGLQQADGPGTKLSGVGDEAFGAEIGIDVKSGNRCLTVSGLTHSELEGHYAPDIAMAKIILGNLH